MLLKGNLCSVIASRGPKLVRGVKKVNHNCARDEFTNLPNLQISAKVTNDFSRFMTKKMYKWMNKLT